MRCWRPGARRRCAVGRTCYRLYDTLSSGRHTSGSAVNPPVAGGRPEGMFGSVPAAAPGEVMQIDSTPVDVLVLLDDGVAGRVELTGMIDVATRVVTAAVLRPTTRSVDASVLLARTLTPEPMRPGWAEALKMARSVLPFERLLSIDERMEHAAARPVIVPDTIVIDHGSVFVSAASGPPAVIWASRSSQLTWPAAPRNRTSSGCLVRWLAVLRVRVRLYRAQPRPARPPRRGRAAVVDAGAAGTAG